jgi:hypothetical protein
LSFEKKSGRNEKIGVIRSKINGSSYSITAVRTGAH